MLLRWQRVGPLDASHEPKVELVAFDEIADYLPEDEPRMNDAARRDQIAERQIAIERRYGLSRR